MLQLKVLNLVNRKNINLLSNEIYFIEESWDDYLFWQKNDKQKLKKINDLLKDIARSPHEGIGKPEALRFKYAGLWSRRIDEEHRLIYKVVEDEIQIYKCRFHYD